MKYLNTYKLFEKKTLVYNYKKFEPFILEFNKVFGEKMKNEGWRIVLEKFLGDYTISLEYDIVNNYIWQPQKNDQDSIIEDDLQAYELAIQSGLLIDNYGIIIGFNDTSFVEHPEEIIYTTKKLYLIKDLNKFNL